MPTREVSGRLAGVHGSCRRAQAWLGSLRTIQAMSRPTLGRLLSAPIIVLLLPAATALAITPVRVYQNPAVAQGLKVKPATLTMAADGNYAITGLRWTGWGSATARATGINHIDNCVPSCAHGHIHKVRVSVRLFNRGFYHGHHVYLCYAVKPAAAAYLRHFCLP